MDGCDTALVVSAKWPDALGLASPLGNVVGIFINGLLTERFGHKKTLLVPIVWLTGCIFIAFIAPNVSILFVGEFLCGLSWGVFTTMAPAYASEVTPVVLRGYLETFVVLCWGIGQFISYGVLDGLINSGGSLTAFAWCIPFAVQWVWPVSIIPLVIFCPQSPWWLVRRGRIAEAEKSFKRLSSSTDANAARDAVALMVETTELERSMTEGANYLDCLLLVGFALSSYAAYFHEQAGLPAKYSYKVTVGQERSSFGVAASWALAMCIIGFISFAPPSVTIGYASSAMYLILFSVYELTVGPVAFIVIGEISSTRLCSKSIALGRNAYNMFSIISFTVAPYILNPTEGNWKGKSGFLAGGLCLLCALWGIFRFPECKGRTYEELDIMFARKLKAWEFESYVIEHLVDIETKMQVEHRE
ncbi:MFS general substrate transporter [Stipitochalara longipes BDJ]|nr:MFS general substrate transporter [Stipitochalara longipes BDJ]